MPQIMGNEIIAMKRTCEQMQPYQRQDCPNCGWMLETSADNILHCKFCGWQDQHPIKREGIEK